MAQFMKTFRKHRKAWLAGLTLMAMFSFVFLDIVYQTMRSGGGPRNPVAAETARYGAITERQLDLMLRQRRSLYGFLRQLQPAVMTKGGRGEQIRIALMSLGDSPASEEAAVESWLLGRKAEELGLKVSQKAINDYIGMLHEGKLGTADLKRILGDLRLSQSQLFEALRQDLLSLRLYEMFSVSLAGVTPAQRWEYYQQLNRRAKIEAVPIAVSQFVDKVPAPAPEVVQKFFEQHKERLPDPNSPEPGFREPHRIDVQFLKASYEAFADAAAVTEQEIKDYYDVNRERYRDILPELPPSEPPKKEPAKTEPAKAEPPKAPPPKAEAPKAQPQKAETPKAEPAKAAVPAKAEPAKSPVKPEEAPKAQAPTTPPEAPKSPSPAAGKTSSNPPPSLFHLVSEEKAGPGPAAAKPASAEKAAPLPPKDQPPATPPAAPGASASKVEPPASKPEPSPPKAAAAGAKPEPAAAKSAPAGAKAPAAPADLTLPPPLTQPGPGGAAPAPAPKYIPLDKVKDEIRKLLAREKAQEKIKDVLRRIQDRLAKYEEQWTLHETLEPAEKAATPAPTPPDFPALAKEFKLTSGQTGLVAAWETQGLEIGRSRVDGSAAFTAVAYDKNFALYRPTTSQDDEGSSYLFWKVNDAPERVPELDEPGVRERVVGAWKLIEARTLASETAERMADEARKAKKPLAEVFAARKDLKVVTPEPFSWLTYGSVPVWLRRLPPRLSEVAGIEAAGSDFMQAVFALKAGEIGPAVNQPKTTVYLVRLAEYLPSESVLWEMFVADDYGSYANVARYDQGVANRIWIDALKAEAGLQWKRDPFRGRVESEF